MQNDYNISKYFDWITSLIIKPTGNHNYSKLLSYLFNKNFRYTIKLDENRYADGINLRYLYDCNHEDCYSMQEILEDKPCSVLEMMIALSIKCENQIMDDPDIGNRTSVWFWQMIDNLGIDCDDDYYDYDYVNNKVNIFLDRQYQYDGTGGLFKVNYPKSDMRQIEIWYQMCWYLDEILY